MLTLPAGFGQMRLSSPPAPAAAHCPSPRGGADPPAGSHRLVLLQVPPGCVPAVRWGLGGLPSPLALAPAVECSCSSPPQEDGSDLGSMPMLFHVWTPMSVSRSRCQRCQWHP